MKLEEMSNAQLGAEQIKIKTEHESVREEMLKLFDKMVLLEKEFKNIQMVINKRNGK